jgi:hypothetical protein
VGVFAGRRGASLVGATLVVAILVGVSLYILPEYWVSVGTADVGCGVSASVGGSVSSVSVGSADSEATAVSEGIGVSGISDAASVVGSISVII